MKRNYWFLIGILGCLVIPVVAFFWAFNLIDSVFNYRSPLHSTPPVAGQALGDPLTRRVVIVIVDALRYDTSLDPQVMPYLNELRGQGAAALMHSQPPSYSEPGYATLLTGAWPSINDGPAVNLDYADIPTFTQDDLFSAAHRSGLPTAISGYYWFEKLVPQAAVDAGFYTPGENAAADQDVMAAALPMLSGDAQLVLIHIDQVDYAGHFQGGPRDPRWNAAASRADKYLRQIVSTLDLKRDTVLVVSDHGQIDRGGHGGPEPVTLLEPYVLAGAGVRPGTYPDVQMVDVAPTLATLLGTNLPASAQGQVLTSMLTLSPKQIASIQAADLIQKQTLYQAYIAAIRSQPTRQPDPTNAASYISAMDSAFAARLNRERLWRGIPAFLLAVFPVALLIIKKDRKALWLVVGGLVYVLIFNFRYAILDGRTYSLSSVDTQTWLITYSMTTAGMALVIGWLVVMFGLRSFRFGARNATQVSLSFVYYTLYLLALPILLHVTLNGFTTTWTLPEFYSAYIALISLIQWIAVAALGLLLVGVSAGIAWLVAKRT